MERFRPDSGTLDLAWRDDLTGVWNRRYLRRLLSEEWPGLTAGHGPVTLLVLDLDGFKPVNDSYGHAAGDRVLRWAAEELRHHFREGDRLIRYGGDEFVVALCDVGAEEARTLAERARFGFTSALVDDPATGKTVEVPISFSIGVASFPEDGTRGEDVLAVADRRLYEEKRQRRKASAPALAGSRGRLAIAAVAAVVAAALATAVAVRRAERPPPPPPDSLSAGSEAPATGAESPREIVVRDEAEIEALRGEVSRLREELAKESAAADRTQYEQKIRELEARLAAAEVEPAPDVVSAAGSDVESVSGMRVGERRSREDLAVSPAAGATEAPAPPVNTAAPPATSGADALAAAAAVVPPRLLKAPRVAYPPLARRHQRTAVVEVELTVNAEGRVTAAEVVGPPAGLGFDEAAREAGLSARFAPGTRGGVPVEMKTRLNVRFEL